MYITSNKLKELSSLKIKKYRDQLSMFAMEGLDFIHEITYPFSIQYIILSERYFYEYGNPFPDIEFYVVKEKDYKKAFDTVTPKGVLAVIKKVEQSDLIIHDEMKILACEEIKDPGNLGNIIRSAAAFGFTDLLLSDNCADAYHPKTLRASAGQFFKIRIYESTSLMSVAKHLKRNKVMIYSSSPKGENLCNISFALPLCLMIGSEKKGLDPFYMGISQKNIRIPMENDVESLNVSVAASLMMYEINQQLKG